MEQTVAAATDAQQELALPGYRDEDVITFDEGLVGFPACKRFVVMENEALSPFRILQSVDQRHVGFLVIDPRVIVKNYNRSIPEDAQFPRRCPRYFVGPLLTFWASSEPSTTPTPPSFRSFA